MSVCLCFHSFFHFFLYLVFPIYLSIYRSLCLFFSFLPSFRFIFLSYLLPPYFSFLLTTFLFIYPSIYHCNHLLSRLSHFLSSLVLLFLTTNSHLQHEIHDPLSPPSSIVHRSRKVFKDIYCISTELLYIGSSWSSYLCLSI